MNILLTAINARYIHSNPAVFSLKSCTGTYSSHVSILEFTINQLPSFILQEIYKKHPDVIAFSCYIWNRSMIEQLILDLHKILPDTDIWAGGPEISYENAHELIARLQLRGLMRGAGEASFSRLVSAYCSGAPESLPDVLDEKNVPRMPLNDIPFWYQDLTDFKHRIIYYESSRGCPFSCSYCLSSIDKAMDFRSVSRVLQELDFFLEQRVPQVKFTDRTFNCRKSHALPILQHILTHDNGITNFHFEIAADLLDEDYFALLEQMRPGAVQLEIGVQSTCAETIAEIGRNMDFKKVTDAVMRIRSFRNIHLHLDLIAGLPFEDLRTFQKSFNDVYALRPGQLQLGFLKVLKGTRIEQNASAYSLLYTSQPPYEVLCTKWISYEDICLLKQIEEVLEIYYNSGQFTNTMDFLSVYFDTPFSMYEALASWYDTHGLFGVQPSRIRKYEILLEFGNARISSLLKQQTLKPLSPHKISAAGLLPSDRLHSASAPSYIDRLNSHSRLLPSDRLHSASTPSAIDKLNSHGGLLSSDREFPADSLSAVLKEYLIYDLYLREHMKNRPSFACSSERWKDTVHDVLHRESETHALFPELSGCSYRELTKLLHAEIFELIFDKPLLILFCYEKRDPLTNNCYIKKLDVISETDPSV